MKAEQTLKEALRDIDFACDEPNKNAENRQGPTYRSLIGAISTIKVIVRETKAALHMR